MDWRTFVTQNWKAIVIVLQIGLIVLSLAALKPLGEPINTPVGP